MIKHGILFHGYADDTQLYIRFRPGDAVSLADAIRRLEMFIREIRMWMTANKLKLNDGKTDFMVIVSAYYAAADNFAGNCHKSGKYKHSSHNVGEKPGGHT